LNPRAFSLRWTISGLALTPHPILIFYIWEERPSRRMLHFPVPRPTSPPASSWRASPDSAYDQASPTRSSSSDKNLPALPQQDHGQILSISQSDIPREASSSNGSKGGFKWWWKGGKKEAERRKSLGIGSSRTAYHVDELSSGLRGVTIGNNGPRASSARSGNLSNSLQFPDTVGGNIHTDPSGRKRTPPPPPIPPRPEIPTSTSIKTPVTSSSTSRTSPTKLYRKYDPPPIQVPAHLPDLYSSPTRSSRLQESGAPSQHMHHSRSQPILHATQAQQRYSAPQQPYLSHSSTTPDLTSSRPIVGPQPPHSQGPRTPHEYRSSALSPTHRDNLADSAKNRSPPSSQRYDKLPPRFQPPTTPTSNRTSTSHLGTPATNSGSPARPGTTGTSRQCSGFTRQGRRCKRMVKTAAPYAALVDGQLEIINKPIAALGSPSSIRNDGRGLVADAGDTTIEEEPRYCRDHVKQICEAEGFYWKGQRGDKWIRFSDWIPDELEEQSKVLLRLTMESALTSRVSEVRYSRW
jgi:hypothetical protein